MSRIFITGGTGSLGSRLTRHFLQCNKENVVVVYSRDPHKQNALFQSLAQDQKRRVRMTLGDIRDKERLVSTMRGSDIVVHTAALKHVDAGEYNTSEFIKTNITGTENIAFAGLEADVSKMLFISTDKAVQAYNLYGRTKAVAERFWIRQNQFGRDKTRFSAIRYGNVFDSRGSVMEQWSIKKRGDRITVRQPFPTRFVCFLHEGVRWVHTILDVMRGGEIFVPATLSAISMLGVASFIVGKDNIDTEPLAAGEKQSESLLSEEEVSGGNTTLVSTSLNGELFFVVNPDEPQWQYSKWVGDGLPDNVKELGYSSSNVSLMNPQTFLDFYRNYKDEYNR